MKLISLAASAGLAFGVGLAFAPSPAAAQAQSCTSTIYLFRHAEDKNGFPSMLTSVGETHAKLYPMMINQLQTTFGLCPVRRVFAMWDRNKKGTDNPYDTALPLAQDVGGMSYVPEMYFTDTDNYKYYLCEFPVDPPCDEEAGIPNNNHRNALSKYGEDINSHLYSYLSTYFETNINSSVAIFYTQQAMPAVSTILGVNPVVVECPRSRDCTQQLPPLPGCPLPDSRETSESTCYDTENKLLSWPGRQRSSVNIFNYQNIFYNPVSSNFPEYPNVLFLKVIQCFNFNNTTEKLSTTKYYCQYSGSLGNGITSTNSTIGKNHVLLTDIKAKMCYYPYIAANNSPVKDSFGHCQ
jgi:hypothetical protein